MSMSTIWRIGATMLAGLAVGGCGVAAGGGKADATTVRRSAARDDSGGAPADGAIERSVLREMAFDVLDRSAHSPTPQVRANALEAMSIAPGRLKPLLPAALQDPNEGVRAIAATIVGRERLCDLAPQVQPLLQDNSPYTRLGAIFALARCDREAPMDQLAAFLLNHRSARVRAQAAWTLGELGNESAKGLLRHASARPVPGSGAAEVRLMQLQIAEALYKLGESSQVETLHGALFPSRPEELEATALAAQILGDISSRRSEADLINLAVYRDETGRTMPAEVRLAAATALARLGRTEEGPRIAGEYARDTNPTVRAQAAMLLGAVGGEGVLAPLQALLEDSSEMVQVAAAGAILRATVPG